MRASGGHWVVTIEGEATDGPVRHLVLWRDFSGRPLPSRILRAWSTGETGDETECGLVREVIFRAVLSASEQAGPPILSLEAGRKTMSADLQLAGANFGCRALVHVITPVPLPKPLAQPDAGAFTRPLPSEVVRLNRSA